MNRTPHHGIILPNRWARRAVTKLNGRVTDLLVVDRHRAMEEEEEVTLIKVPVLDIGTGIKEDISRSLSDQK